MCQVGHAVFSFEIGALEKRVVDLAVIAEAAVVVAVECGHDGGKMTFSVSRIIGRLPIELDGLCRLERIPGIAGHDGGAVRQRNDFPNTAHAARRFRIKIQHAATQLRIPPHGGIQHVVEPHIDRKLCRAGALGEHVHARL